MPALPRWHQNGAYSNRNRFYKYLSFLIRIIHFFLPNSKKNIFYKNLPEAFPNLVGQKLLINLGYGAEFKGKVQKLEIGTGPDEVQGTESRTFCGIEYRTVSSAFRKYKVNIW